MNLLTRASKDMDVEAIVMHLMDVIADTDMTNTLMDVPDVPMDVDKKTVVAVLVVSLYIYVFR